MRRLLCTADSRNGVTIRMSDFHQSKSNSIVSNITWKLMERFGAQGIQFVLQIILARLLDVEIYGVLSLMLIFTSLANIFIQFGFSTALTQNKDVTEEDYSSVFWVTLGIAGMMYALIFVGAPLIAEFYAMPSIVSPLRALALMLFPGAMNSVQLSKVAREMNFKKVFYSNIGGTLVAGIVSVIIAYMGGGLWALVAQNILSVSVACVVMLFTAKWYPKFVLNLKRIKELFSFGWKLLVSGLLDTLYQDLRSLVIGKKYDSSTLAYYNRGKQFPQFIIGAINGAIQSVMLPAMSAEQDNKAKVKEMMRTSMTMSAYIIFPMMAGLAAVSTPLVKLLLTDKWLPCVPYMMVYCFSQAFYPVHSCNLQAINAMGRSDLFLKLEIIKKIYGVTILAIAVFCFDSPLAIAMTGLITTWLGWFVNSFPNKQLIGYSYREQIFDLFPILFMALGMCGIVLLIGKWCLVSQIPLILTLLIQIVVGVVIYVVLSLIVRPRPFTILFEQIQGILKK